MFSIHSSNKKLTMKISAVLTLSLLGGTAAFAPSLVSTTHRISTSPALFAAPIDSENSEFADAKNSLTSRRAILRQTIATTAASLVLPTLAANADDAVPTVVVAGATGQTGRRILERLASQPNTSVIAGVRNVDKVRFCS